MVSYWKTKEAVQAKVIKNKDGQVFMQMDGEKHRFPGFPRGFLLFGKLSKLKHEIKNQIFNDSWHKLEAGESEESVAAFYRNVTLPKILELAEDTRYDRVPAKSYSDAVRELHRAWTAVIGESGLKEIVCLILQEDDAYRFRFQWMANYVRLWPWSDHLKVMDYALSMLEHGEVIDDMKERERLFRRIFMVLVRAHKEQFIAFMKEIDWKKVRLSEADKYHFRGKYFKVDYDLFEY